MAGSTSVADDRNIQISDLYNCMYNSLGSPVAVAICEIETIGIALNVTCFWLTYCTTMTYMTALEIWPLKFGPRLSKNP